MIFFLQGWLKPEFADRLHHHEWWFPLCLQNFGMSTIIEKSKRTPLSSLHVLGYITWETVGVNKFGPSKHTLNNVATICHRARIRNHFDFAMVICITSLYVRKFLELHNISIGDVQVRKLIKAKLFANFRTKFFN